MTIHKRIPVIVGAIALLLLAGLSLGLAYPSAALAWDNCPRGEVDCVYPGECSRYVDTNGDDICDLSQPEPAPETTTTIAATTTTVATDSKVGDTTTATGDDATAAAAGASVLVAASGSATTSTTAPPSGGSYGASTADAADSAASGDSTTLVASAETAASGAAMAASAGDSGGIPFFTHYLVSPIALGFLLIYGLSFVLYKTKRIRITTHRKVWNVLLLATFLATGIFGVLLTIQLDYTLPFTIPIDMLFWHVEAGIVMTFISLFHMGWHFKYYRNLVRTGRSKVRAARVAERLQAADEKRLVLEAREQRRAEREAHRIEQERVYAAERRPRPARPQIEPEV